MGTKKRKQKNNRYNQEFHWFVYFLAMVLPILLYTIAFVGSPSAANGFVVMGIAGSLLMGAMLCVKIATKETKLDDLNEQQRLRKNLLFGLPMLFAVLLIGVSLCFAYIPGLYDGLASKPYINKNYFVLWLFFCMPLSGYAGARVNVKHILKKKKIGYDSRYQRKKGFFNHWFYLSLHRKHKLPFIFYPNVLFLITYFPGLALHTTLGWWKTAGDIVGVLFSFSSFLAGILHISWSWAGGFAEKYGKKYRVDPGPLGVFASGILCILCGWVVWNLLFMSGN